MDEDDSNLRNKLKFLLLSILAFYSFNIATRVQTMDTQFYDSLLSLVPFMLIQFQATHIMFYYFLISSKLQLIKLSMLDTIRFYNVDQNVFNVSSKILEFPTDTVIIDGSLDKMKNKLIIKKISTFKDAYFRCWLLRLVCNDLFSWFLLILAVQYMIHFICIVIQFVYPQITELTVFGILGLFIFLSIRNFKKIKIFRHCSCFLLA